VLFSNEAELPANQAASRGLVTGFTRSIADQPLIYTEFLDLVRFGTAAHQERVANFLKEKYAGMHFDLALALGSPSLEFLIKRREELVPDVPIVFAGINAGALRQIALPLRTTGIVSRWDLSKTLALALQLQPQAKQATVISGASDFDRALEAEVREQLRPYASQIAINYLSGVRLEDLLQRVARLPKNSFLILLTYFTDDTGRRFIPKNVGERIALLANVPLYSFADPMMGVGIVGGYMDTFESVGEEAARVGLRILNGEDPENISPHAAQTHRYVVDWRQLQRWNLSEASLPQGTEVRFKQPTAWEQYRTEILAIAGALLLQTVLLFKSFTEIRRRRRAEHEARASKERMDLAISAVKLGLWDWDIKKGKIWATNSCRAMFGLSAGQELTRQTFADCLVPDDRERIRGEIDTAIAEWRPFQTESRTCTLGGSSRWIAIEGGPKGNSDEGRMVGVVIDVTARKQAEMAAEQQQRELAHLSRVSVLGALSGAIAHELNQPLTAIRTNVESATRILDRSPIDTEEIHQILQDILLDDKRAGDVIKHMRALLHRGESLKQTVAVNTLVSEVMELARSDLVLKNIMVSKRLAENLPAIQGDPVQLRQVVLNLIVNGCEAMTDKRSGDRLLVVETGRDNNGKIRISVSDNGEGITGDGEKLFEPFYTTKTLGLGLGLPICRNIVMAHGGHLWAESRERGGAVFHIELPIESGGHG
jgi:PAS domain S-box-containing protein